MRNGRFHESLCSVCSTYSFLGSQLGGGTVDIYAVRSISTRDRANCAGFQRGEKRVPLRLVWCVVIIAAIIVSDLKVTVGDQRYRATTT